MPRATVNGLELYDEEHGRGFPLLLLMGFGGDCHGWSRQVPAFAARYRTIVYDHRGVGQSAKPPVGYSIAQFGADALGLLDHLGVSRAHLVGYSMGGRIAQHVGYSMGGRIAQHVGYSMGGRIAQHVGYSMGGRIAQHVAAHHPDRVGGLVLAATAARPNALNLYSLKAGAYLYEKFGPEAAGAFGPLVSFTHAHFASHLPEAVAALGKPPEHPMPLHAYLGHVRAIEEHDTTGVLAQIGAPTLVLLGDQEWLNPLAEAERLVAGIPGARLQILPGGGHGFIWEIADAFNDAVLRFLGTVG